MTDQPNQDRRRKKSPDPTHLHSVDGSDATAADTAKDVPAEPGASQETYDPGRKVMSTARETRMKW
jgi:hypothetical protein